MGKFSCSLCNYTSDRKDHVKNHIEKRKDGSCKDATINEIKIYFNCEYCDKRYTTNKGLKRHQRESCKVQLEELKIKLAETEAKLAEKPQTVINNYIQVNINGYRKTSFEHLTDLQYQRAVRRMIYTVPQMIQDVHFNPKVPENHNIYISNIKNKYAMVYDGKKWCSKPQDQVIDQLINDQEYAIEEWLGEGDKFPKEMKKFNEYLEKKDNSNKADEIKDVIKEEVKLLLYNNRGVIKHARTLIQ